MTNRLRFGTAGLRGPLGEGPLRMNVQQVELAAIAISRWLPAASTVIIGRDARHGSLDFARVTARVLTEAGHQVRQFEDPVPTPVVAFVVATTEAAAGVMVTASHNPATDNGYKVYSGDGGQILPDDAAVIEHIMADSPWPTSVDVTSPEGVESLGQPEVNAYIEAIVTAVRASRPEADETLGVRIAYSAMHGVGGEIFRRMLTRCGHVVYHVVEQHAPNPDFPTAPFPNLSLIHI